MIVHVPDVYLQWGKIPSTNILSPSIGPHGCTLYRYIIRSFRGCVEREREERTKNPERVVARFAKISLNYLLHFSCFFCFFLIFFFYFFFLLLNFLQILTFFLTIVGEVGRGLIFFLLRVNGNCSPSREDEIGWYNFLTFPFFFLFFFFFYFFLLLL